MIEVLIQRTLPAAGGDATPPFTDVRTARDWLKLLPMINVPVAHLELRQAIALLNQSNLPALESLKIIEQFRESVHIVQDALTSKLIGKAFPLNADEHTIWASIDALWRELETCYARAWRCACQNEIGITEFIPLLAERTLYYASKSIVNLAHIYRKPSDKQWRQLFAYYELAQAQHIEKLKARDSLIQLSGVTTPEATFLHALLFSAANPYQYTFKQQIWLSHRLEVLATRSHLGTEAQTLPNRPALYIDLQAPSSPQRRTQTRRSSELEIDTLALAQVLSKRIKLLRMGELPEKIGLGNELSPQAVESILRDLYRAWCEHPSERALTRRPTDRKVEVGIGLENLHLIFAKHHFAPPPQSEQHMSSTELMQIRMFGQTSARSVVAPIATETLEWEISNETAQGLCLQRSNSDTRQRLQLQQLILIIDGEHQLIGQVRWLAEHGEQREVGVELMPGPPQAACIRAQDAARFGQGDFSKVITLGALPALKSPISLLLPLGWFRQGRLLDYWDGEHLHRIRLVSLLSRGSDFERIHYVQSGGL